jgi:serralysin
LGNASANGSGVWSFTTGTLANGAHNFTALDTDAAGNISLLSTTLAVTVDTVAPSAPVIAGETVVNTHEITLVGTAEANSTVNIYDGTILLGDATTNTSGAWNFTTGALADGVHTFTATDTDAAGNTSILSQAITSTIGTDSFSDVTAGVIINGTRGNDVIDATHGIHGVFATNGNDTIYGAAGNDVLSGLGGDDTIDGGTGADKMMGGPGNDTYIVDNKNDQVIEYPNQGTDTVQSSVTYTLPANVENLTLTGHSSINGTGNALDNVIIGNSANNILTGLGGNDILTGGGGSDTFVFGPNFGHDTITDFQATGSNHGILQFSHNTFNSFAAVLAHAAQVGSNVVITVDAADSITLQNIHLASLKSNDIHIV